jgi:hypothetical protein
MKLITSSSFFSQIKMEVINDFNFLLLFRQGLAPSKKNLIPELNLKDIISEFVSKCNSVILALYLLIKNEIIRVKTRARGNH